MHIISANGEVIYHKANISFNAIAERVYEGLLERGLVYSYVEILEIFENTSRDTKNHPYLEYTDTSLVRLLRDICYQKKDLPDVSDPVIPTDMLLDFIRKIVQREPLKQIYEQSALSEKSNKRLLDENWSLKISEQKQKFQQARLDERWLIQTNVTSSVTSIKPYVSIFDGQNSANPDEAIRIYNAKNLDNPISILSEDESSIIRVLADKDLIIRGLYTKDNEYKKRLNV